MAVNLSFIGGAGWQFFTDDGVPLSGGKIYTYAAGTTTPQTTYTSRDGITPNSNPIILDAAGRTPQQIWSTEGLLYKYVVKDADDVLIRSWDNIGGSVVASDLAQNLANTTNNALGDALVGFKQSNTSGFLSGAVSRTVNNKLQEFVSVLDFGADPTGTADSTTALQTAIDTADAAGVWLFWNKGTYRITSGISVILSQMRWRAQQAVIFVDAPNDILRGVNITLQENTSHQLVGDGFEVDANGLCHSALRFIQPLGTQSTSLYLEKVGARNVEMQVGVGEGSHGFSVRGGFSQVKLIDCYAENIMMRTGAGVVGTRGVTGIIVQNNFGVVNAYPKNIVLVRPSVHRVYSESPSYQYDMDGIGLFAPSTGSTFGPSYAEITESDISGCWGRDVKSQVDFTTVNSPKSLINEGPTGGIINPAYDFQSGPGLITGGQYIVDGVNATLAIVAFRVSSTNVSTSSRWDGAAINIINEGTLNSVVFTDSIGVVDTFAAYVSNVSVNGNITNFAQQVTNGFDIHTIKLDGVICSGISEALVKVLAGGGGAAPYRGRVITKNCINLGATVPTVRCFVPGNAAGVLLDDTGGIGFGPSTAAYVSTATTVTGLSFDDAAKFPTPLSSATNSGTEKLYAFTLASDADITLPAHGFANNYMAQLVAGINRTSFAVLSVDSSGIVSIDVGSGANIGTTSDPGSGDFRVWRNTGTNQLVVKNGSASTRVFLVKFFG